MDYNDHFNLLLAMTLKLRVIIDPNENTIFISMIKASICSCFPENIPFLDLVLMENIFGVFLQ